MAIFVQKAKFYVTFKNNLWHQMNHLFFCTKWPFLCLPLSLFPNEIDYWFKWPSPTSLHYCDSYILEIASFSWFNNIVRRYLTFQCSRLDMNSKVFYMWFCTYLTMLFYLFDYLTQRKHYQVSSMFHSIRIVRHH